MDYHGIKNNKLLNKAKFFVLGCDDLTIAVDHKPLLGIFSDRCLDMANNRLRNSSLSVQDDAHPWVEEQSC